MSGQTKITVVIPFFNSMAYIERCLESVVEQTLKEIQIICVDDGSTDSSEEIVQLLIQKDKRILLLSQHNGGAGKARNLSFEFITGEYVIFLDADDFLSKDALSTAYSLAKKNESDVVVLRSLTFRDGNEGQFWEQDSTIRFDLLPRKEKFALAEVQRDIFSTFTWWPWDKLIKKDLIFKNALYFQEIRTTNDLLFVFSAMFMAKSISITKTHLVYHRVCANSLSVSREKSWTNFIQALLAVKDFLIRKKAYSQREFDFLNYVMTFTVWQFCTLSFKSMLRVRLLYLPLIDLFFNISNRSPSFFYDGNKFEIYSIIIGKIKNPIIIVRALLRNKKRMRK